MQERALNEHCGFLTFSVLMAKIEGIRQLGIESSVKPEFLDQMAEYFTEDELA